MSTRQLFRTGALIVAAQVAVAILGLLALRFFTALVSPAVFGESNLVLSALGLGLQLFVAGFVAAQLRFYSEAEAQGDADRFTRETLIWALRAAAMLIGLAFLVLLPLRLSGLFICSYAVAALGALWLLTVTVRNVLMSRIQAQRRQKLYAKLQVAEALLLFGVTLLALSWSPSVESFLGGQIAAYVAFLALLLLEPAARGILRRQSGGRRALGSKTWAYGAPFAPLSFLSWLANLGDRYTLAIMAGSDAAGRYVAPFSIASRGMMLANSALCDLFRPMLFAAENSRDDHAANNAFVSWLISSLALSGAGLAIVYFAGDLLARWLLADGFRAGATPIMLWVSLGYTISGITQIVECRLLSLGHSARLILPMVMGAIANVAFSVVLIRANGIIGAAQATCASFIFQNLATVGFLLHALRQRSANRSRETKVEPA